MGYGITIGGVRNYVAHERLEPQESLLSMSSKTNNFKIGIPKERQYGEKRVPIIPSDVASLTSIGHHVIIESGAGLQSNFTDREYAEVGAEITFQREQVYKCHIILKVAPPSIEESSLFQPDQIIISPLYLPELTQDIIELLSNRRVIAIAMEYLMDQDGTFPLVRIMSELAGRAAILSSSELLTNTSHGNGTLLGGISGVPPAKVVILGAGVVGEYATRTALGLGAHIVVFDKSIYKLMRIQNRIGRNLYTLALSPSNVSKELIDADVVIGAIHSKTGRSPIVVTEQMVESMKPNSVIVDVSIDQGGCVETSQISSQEKPTFIKHGVIHYCVPNIASRYARTASIAFSNILTPILINAGQTTSFEQLFYGNPGLRHGIYIYKGRITNQYIAHRFNKKFTDLDLLMTSSL